jgi:hypothetical protein
MMPADGMYATASPYWDSALPLRQLAVTLANDHGNGKVVFAYTAQRRNRIHILSRRLALPERIFSLSASDSGTVCIHSMDGGFITNGQSMANRT